MPVRFRCAYCNQLMGISHRKIGTVVRCPKCSGQIVVPEPGPESEPDSPHDEADAGNDCPDREFSAGRSVGAVAPGGEAGSDPSKALEDPELEMLLAGAAKEAAGAAAKSKPKRKPRPEPMIEIDVEPIEIPVPPVAPMSAPMPMPIPAMPVPDAAPPKGLAVPRWLIAAAGTLVLLLMGLSFLIGFLLGKQSALGGS